MTDAPTIDPPTQEKSLDAEGLFDLMVKHSQTIFLDLDEPNPELPVGMFFAVGSDGALSIIQAPWRNEQEKEQLLLRIKMFFKEKGIVMYGLAQETWSIERSREQHETDSRRPSECDDRKEHIFYAVVQREGKSIFRRQEILRPWDGGHPTLGTIEDLPYDMIKGRMVELLDFDTWTIGGVRISRRDPNAPKS